MKVAEMADAINKTLADYQNATMETMKASVDNAAKNAVSDLKATSPTRKRGGGAYAKSWKSKVEKSSKKWAYGKVVYNEKHYRLTHLLENGHKVVNTKRIGKKTWVDARPHIADVEQRVIEQMTEELKRGI